MKIQIGNIEIGDACPPYIIAEVGSNWLTFEDCKHSISMAKQCGADAVKFQAFDEVALYGMRRLTDATDPRNCSLSIAELEARGSLNKTIHGQLPLDWLPKLKEKADACGIEFMCSAFSPELIDAVDPFVSLHKVASSELTHVRMLEKLRKIGKPVILSTGASGEADIRYALDCLAGRNTQEPVASPLPVVLMYCIASYPTSEINFDTLNLFKRTFGGFVGFSDHSTFIHPVPALAIQSGACVLEKHFSAIDADTPDRPHSLDVDQFKRMVDHIRGRVLPGIGPTREERDMLVRHNRRLIATQDIEVGVTLKEGVNFGIYRSLKDDTKALSPWCIGSVEGKVAKQVIKMGDGIGPQDI